MTASTAAPTGTPTPDLSFLDPGPKPDPYPAYRRLRELSPVHVVESAGHRSLVLSNHADIAAALRNPSLGHGRGGAGGLDGAVPESGRWLARKLTTLAVPFVTLVDRWMLFVDPPYHTFLRGQVGRAFVPAAMESQREAVLRITDELIDLRLGTGTGTIDLRADLSYPLAIYMIGELIGVPREDHKLLRKWARYLAGAIDPQVDLSSPLRMGRFLFGVRGSVRHLEAYFGALADEKRRNPGQDLLSTLVTRDDEGRGLTPDELTATCILLIVAGHITTVDLIANGMLGLFRDPDQMALLRSRPDLAASMTEELLRYDSPVQLTGRVALTECQVSGVELRKGDDLTLLLASGNRDPAVFENPDRIDLTRSPNPHLAFSGGIHYCLGAALARIETQIAVPRVLERLPGLELAAEPEWMPGVALRGVATLPARFRAS